MPLENSYNSNMTDYVEVREGFLCPVCMKDLVTFEQLQTHFEVAHNTEEDGAAFRHLKELLGKAKKKILKDPSIDSASSDEGTNDRSRGGATSAFDPSAWEVQEFGASSSHTEYFKQVRDSRVDRFVVETNKLLLRLDKLIVADVAGDTAKRKASEKDIVPWVPDQDVHYCLICGIRFSLVKRKHHCRLCGGIICSKCSVYLPFAYARKLTNPAFALEEPKQLGVSSLPRTGSSGSLNSMTNAEGEQHIRICTECRRLLDRRDQLIEQRTSKPIIVQFYERMKVAVDEVEKGVEVYTEMANSLSLGETRFELAEAQKLNVRLAKLYETIDVISKKIAALNMGDEVAPHAQQARLQRCVRLYAAAFLQERGAQGLRGWAPAAAAVTTSGVDVDPMLQQMSIIRDYIRKAKQARRFDEVQMLQANLEELQVEYKRQQRRLTAAS
ncbi:PREDICTED: rabenosyn-5-like [Priapulus caudatus]|uniref:Rabenosyn-5-like n=1 Tax=Priapulus caudatus TaxID=37621 RepID=A0ABM1E6S0_PRICU|nr:PREDICTED: rabenosyn-5-like [Priapulus caudatus]